MSNTGILEEITIVNDFDRNNRGIFVIAEEFVWSFPDRRDGVLESRSGEDVVDGVISEEDFGKGVKITREGLGLIEVLGLVDDQTNDTNT